MTAVQKHACRFGSLKRFQGLWLQLWLLHLPGDDDSMVTMVILLQNWDCQAVEPMIFVEPWSGAPRFEQILSIKNTRTMFFWEPHGTCLLLFEKHGQIWGLWFALVILLTCRGSSQLGLEPGLAQFRFEAPMEARRFQVRDVAENWRVTLDWFACWQGRTHLTYQIVPAGPAV